MKMHYWDRRDAKGIGFAWRVRLRMAQAAGAEVKWSRMLMCVEFEESSSVALNQIG